MKEPLTAAMGWSVSNQRLLSAEFARIAAALQGDPADTAVASLAQARSAMPGAAAIDAVQQGFGLSEFERDVLLLCAGAEMDAGLASACANADPARPFPTFGLALARLPGAHWSALAPVGPLRRWHLLQLDEDSIMQTRLRADERILHHLAGVNHLDARLLPLVRPVTNQPLAPSQKACANRIAEALHDGPRQMPITMLLGDSAQDLVDVAADVVTTLGRRLYRLRATDLPHDDNAVERLVTLWLRDAQLLQAALLVQLDDDASPIPALRFAERAVGLTFVATRQPVETDRAQLRFEITAPNAPERLALWCEALPGIPGDQLSSAAYQFRMSVTGIRAAADRLAPALAQGKGGATQVWEHCREQMRNGMQGLAELIEARRDWQDLVLPEAQLATLRQVAAQLKHREQVHHDWGFAAASARGLGMAVLFSGESGTGKTMAAEVLARDIGLDLYRVDLSAVVSKYIGETEKNLRRVFDAAEGSGAVLLFDEADALFGKRSEVKDSHDRYANVEVSYLLQRMENYQGLAILTTNFKSALDPAFLRRLRFVVHFPFPDQAEREALWRKAFPARAPLEAVDVAALARLQLSGGSIRNVALHAAFLAAAAGGPIGMPQLEAAAQQEMARYDRHLKPLALRSPT